MGISVDGLCECGCGEPAPISRFTSETQGYVRGQPRRFIYGHWARLKQRRPIEERFHASYEIDPLTGCWMWKGSLTRGGYGVIYTGEKKDGDHRQSINVSAHRWSYAHFVGPIGEGLVVRHTCDNPPCVNPQHLLQGTQLENVADSFARGRRGRKA